MTTAYYRYGVQYPIIIEYDPNYWEYSWYDMENIEIVYLFPEED